MSTFNQGTHQTGDGNLNEPITVGRLGQPVKFGGGTEWVRQGSSNSLTDRPSASELGKGIWQVGNVIYISNGESYTSTLDENSNTFVAFGDSITSNFNVPFLTTITSIVRSGDVVTANTTGNTLISVGAKIKVANIMPDDLNGIHEVATASGAAFTYIKAGIQGTATILGSPNPSGGVMEIMVLDSFSSNGSWLWLNNTMGGNLELVMNCARGGWRADYMAQTILDREAEITATGKTAKNAYIRMGINDINAGRSAAQIIASLTTIIQHNLDHGRRVFIDTILPLGTGHASFTADKNAIITTVNRWILKDAIKTMGVYAIDSYTPTVLPLTGAAKANVLSSDDIHPRPFGCIKYLAPAIRTELLKHISSPTILPASAVDTFGANANSNNLNDIGPWVTTGGGTASGNVLPGAAGVCLGLIVAEFGAASQVDAQINTNADGYIEQQVNLTGTVALGDYAEIIVPFTVTRLTAGNEYKTCFKVSLENLDAANGNIDTFSAYLEIVAAGNTGYTHFGNYISTYSLTGIEAGVYTYDVVSPDVKIPVGLTSFRLHIRLQGKGAVAGTPATMKVSRIGLIPA